MSFATSLALLVGVLVAAPILAHLLRRGKTQEHEFPPAHLVPQAVVTSEQRRRLEDRYLLLVRALMILTLAVLGATPFVRCSRLSVERESGASVALAIVIDQSQSMRAVNSDGDSRFKSARRGAEQLLDSAREGDAVAIVLAGKPAHLLLSPTTDLAAARKALTKLKVSDRGTALPDAVQLARSSLKDLPHADKRVVVLSDLADDPPPTGDPEIWTPLPGLADDLANCGVAKAERQGQSVVATIGCNNSAAASGRQLELYVLEEPDSEALASAALDPIPGQQKLSLKHDSLGLEVGVRLTGTDAIERDDRAEVTREAVAEIVGVVADSSRASAITGGPTVVEQALSALFPSTKIRPLVSVPEAAEDLADFSAIVIDDPPGLSPEARAALGEWLERGGVCLGLLGPTSTTAQLAASLSPFARKGAEWENNVAASIDTNSVAWLGSTAETLATLGRGGRLRLDGVDLPDTAIVGRWTDGVPWLFRRNVGRGLVYTAGLSASVELSDFALRPGFLALLDAVVNDARTRSGPRSSAAGTHWNFPANAELKVRGPDGLLPIESTLSEGVASLTAVPELTGRYQIELDDKQSTRVVVLDSEELTHTPLNLDTAKAIGRAGASNDRVDASPEWALFVLALFALELLFRVYGERLKAYLTTRRQLTTR
jgi:hypothetical protein